MPERNPKKRNLSGLFQSYVDRARAVPTVTFAKGILEEIVNECLRRDWEEVGDWIFANIETTLYIGDPVRRKWNPRLPNVFHMRHQFNNPFPHKIEVRFKLVISRDFSETHVEAMQLWLRLRAKS